MRRDALFGCSALCPRFLCQMENARCPGYYLPALICKHLKAVDLQLTIVDEGGERRRLKDVHPAGEGDLVVYVGNRDVVIDQDRELELLAWS